MEERPLSFDVNEDPTLVEFDEKDKAQFIKNCNETLTAVSYAKELVSKDRLTVGMRETMCTVIDHGVQDICKKLDYDTKFKKDQEKTLREIRELNIENRELRRQLGDKLTFEDFREKIKTVIECFRWWSKRNGFGFTTDIVFIDYGFMKCKMYMDIEPGEDDNDAKIERLKEYGFTFNNRKNDYPCVEATKENFELLAKYFSQFIPDFSITKSEVTCYNNLPLIRYIELTIKNLDFIDNVMNEYVEYRKAEETRWLNK